MDPAYSKEMDVETEEILKKEAKIDDSLSGQGSDVNSVLTGYKSDGDPEKYEDCYIELKCFVEGSLDIYKYELRIILYPVLVHMYLELIYNEHYEQAIKILQKYGPEQEFYYQDDLRKIAFVTKREHMDGNELIDTFQSNQFIIRISRDTLSLLKGYLQDKKNTVLMNIVQEHLYFDMYEGVARNKTQIDATSGALIGEATRQDNTAKVYYGTPKTPEYAPPIDRMPLPQLRDCDKFEKRNALREARRLVDFDVETPPTICCHTLMNSNNTVNCADITEDSSMLAVGFSHSIIKVWTLVSQKLCTLKTASQLQTINPEADNVMARIMDESSGETSRTLVGHNGNVYSVSFSPDRTMLLSSSEDGTIRLWSLQLWKCLVVYKGHIYPVSDVKFSPVGYYFVSASFDKTARLWATDNNQPLRLFVGHFANVHCVQFHPNINYVATGSSDRRVCLWDCTTGKSVRTMTGHKSPVYSLAFSVCGRYLASAGTDCKILTWDLAHGHLVAEFSAHEKPIHTLSFSRCGNVLATGSLDCTIKFWNFNKLTEECNAEDVNNFHNPEVKSGDNYFLWSCSTKSSPLKHLHFSRINVLLAVTMYNEDSTSAI